MKRPNILFLAQLPPPIHGASVINKMLTESVLVNSNFNLIVIPLNFVKNINQIGKASFLKIWYLFLIIVRLFKSLFLKNLNLVYITLAPIGYAFYRDILFITIIKFFKKKIVIHLHGKGIKEAALKSKINFWLYRYVFKNTSVIILSERLADDIEAVYKSRPYVLNNGIMINVKTPKTNFNFHDQVVFLFLSNLVLSKGIKVFLEAIYLTHQLKHNFKVKIIGNSADFSIEQTKAFVAERNLTQIVEILGPKYADEKLQELNLSDVFVFPTMNDCFPLSILEAMQMGLPVISTSNGAIPDIIQHNLNGIIVRENNVKDVSNAMITYIENRNLLKTHGINNQLRFKSNYTQEIFERNFVYTMNQILSN